MNITILEGGSANPGDVSWEPISALGNVTIHDNTSEEELIPLSRNADIIVINKLKVGLTELEALPNLKMVCVLASGKDNVDEKAASERNIIVENAVGYGSNAVAQHVFALLLELTNYVTLHNESVQNGEWTDHWCYWKRTPMEISGKRFGIYGFGKIGQQVARQAAAFGMEVFIVSQHANPSDQPSYHFVDMNELFQKCDIISLHSPLKESNSEIINASLLAKMKEHSILINTARGGLINEKDLREALIRKRPAVAALDVLSSEPPETDHPLIGLENCIITPHMAWAAKEARQRLIGIIAEKIKKLAL